MRCEEQVETRVKLSCHPGACHQAPHSGLPAKPRFGIGDAPKNPIAGPGVADVDLSIYKYLPLMSGVRRQQFRVEVYYRLNRTQFTTIGNTASLNAPGSRLNRVLGHFTAAVPAPGIAAGRELCFR
jgi:hypothetical protein